MKLSLVSCVSNQLPTEFEGHRWLRHRLVGWGPLCGEGREGWVGGREGAGDGDGLERSPKLPPSCRQPMGLRHSHPCPVGPCLSMYILRVSPESSRCSQRCSRRTMPNLSQHLSAQPPASAPRTWTQSQSRPENGKKLSDPVHQQLLFI